MLCLGSRKDLRQLKAGNTHKPWQWKILKGLKKKQHKAIISGGRGRLFKYLEDFVSALNPQVNCTVFLSKHKGSQEEYGVQGVRSRTYYVHGLVRSWIPSLKDKGDDSCADNLSETMCLVYIYH